MVVVGCDRATLYVIVRGRGMGNLFRADRVCLNGLVRGARADGRAVA